VPEVLDVLDVLDVPELLKVLDRLDRLEVLDGLEVLEVLEVLEGLSTLAHPAVNSAPAAQPNHSAGDEKAKACRFACVRSIGSPSARNDYLQRPRLRSDVMKLAA